MRAAQRTTHRELFHKTKNHQIGHFDLPGRIDLLRRIVLSGRIVLATLSEKKTNNKTRKDLDRTLDQSP